MMMNFKRSKIESYGEVANLLTQVQMLYTMSVLGQDHLLLQRWLAYTVISHNAVTIVDRFHNTSKLSADLCLMHCHRG